MPPATRPGSSWLRPSEGDTFSTLTTLKASGRAPYLSCWARVSAAVWLPSPVICTWPAGMASVVAGAETTLPSSTIAVWSSTWSSGLVLALGWYLLAWVAVSLPNALVALPFRVRLTTGWLEVESIPDDSLVTSVPRMTALSSTYLTPLSPQATVWELGASHWASVYSSLVFQVLRLVQSSLLNSFMPAGVTALALPAVVAAEPVGLADGETLGVADELALLLALLLAPVDGL